jgi:hypothetical protein
MLIGTPGLNNCQFLQWKIEVETQIAADLSKLFEIHLPAPAAISAQGID